MTRARTVVTVSMIVGLAMAAWPAVAAPAPDEGLNDKGVELRRKGDDRGALDAFQKAYDLTHSPRATAQLGLVYQALGRWELAGPLVEKALQSPGDAWVKKYQAQLQEALTTIKQHLARIELTGEPEGADVIVNGVPAGKLPLPGPLTVSIGTVDLQVRASGYRDDIRKVTLAAYQYEHIFVRLDKLPDLAEAKPIPPVTPPPTDGAVAPKPPQPDETSEGGVAPRTIIKWSALGLGAAGLTTGLVTALLHQSKISDFNNDGRKCQDNGGTAMVNGNPDAACQSLLDSAHTYRTWEIIGFVAGGAFAATYLVLQLTEPPTGSSGTTAAWSCVPSLATPGAACAVRF